MKPHLQCAEQQVSRSNLTKYCACHAERLTYLVLITYETSSTLRGAKGVTIQPHQKLRLPRKVTLEQHQILPLPRKVTLELHQVLYLPRKVTRIVHPRDIWNLIYNKRSNQCHPPNSPNTTPATQNDHLTSGRNLRKTGETSFPMRGRSENDPSMIREWSDHENANRNPPRKWGYFSSSPGAFSIVKYNVSSPILHSNIHLLYYSTLLDATLFDSTVLDSTLLDSTLLDSSPLDLLYLILLYLTLLYLTYSTWHYSTWLYST